MSVKPQMPFSRLWESRVMFHSVSVMNLHFYQHFPLTEIITLLGFTFWTLISVCSYATLYFSCYSENLSQLISLLTKLCSVVMGTGTQATILKKPKTLALPNFYTHSYNQKSKIILLFIISAFPTSGYHWVRVGHRKTSRMHEVRIQAPVSWLSHCQFCVSWLYHSVKVPSTSQALASSEFCCDLQHQSPANSTPRSH